MPKLTTIQVQVLSRDDDPLEFNTLADLHYHIYEGSHIGAWRMVGMPIVYEGQALHDKLCEIGNDGTFFDNEYGDEDD